MRVFELLGTMKHKENDPTVSFKINEKFMGSPASIQNLEFSYSTENPG